MQFERGKDSKDAMGIGLTRESIGITGLTGNIDIRFYQNNGNSKTIDAVLKKRWYVPLRAVLFLLKKDSISFRLLRLFFYARHNSIADAITSWFESFGICVQTRRLIRKANGKKKSAKIELNDSGWSMEKGRSSNSYADLKFSFQTDDVKKAEKLKSEGKNIEGVMYKGKVYPLGKNIKHLKV